MRRLPRLVLLASLGALLLAHTADAKVLLATHGSKERLRSQTGQRSDGEMMFVGWNRGWTWGGDFAAWWPRLGRVPIISLGTNNRWRREAITPRGIAMGNGDRYLKAFGRAIHAWGGPIIIRPMAEMNGHWNFYSAYNANGTRRNAAHSQRNFRRAFKRLYLILHGGDRAAVNRKLARSGMPPVSGNLPQNPYPTLKIVWNPQGYGSPNVPGNRAHVYYPGDAYVDLVANDLYSIDYRYAWEANLALFRRYRNKPYAIGEFGLWGIDHPAFVRRIGSFIRNHPRVKLAIFFEAQRGSIFDLASKPRSRAAYRNQIARLNR